MLHDQLLGLQVLELCVGLGIPAKQSWAETFVGDPVPDSSGSLRSHGEKAVAYEFPGMWEGNLSWSDLSSSGTTVHKQTILQRSCSLQKSLSSEHVCGCLLRLHRLPHYTPTWEAMHTPSWTLPSSRVVRVTACLSSPRTILADLTGQRPWQ